MQNCFDKCEKKKCCGVSKVVIPAALGDENGQYKPENGAYFNTLVEYQASGVSYMYTNDGIPTRMGDGIVATIEVGETTTLQPGEDATVENVGDKYHAVLIFGIPEGQKGDTGDAATVNVGTTTTGAPGSDATVTNSGDEHSAILNFTIPRGPQGEQGVPGQAATIAVGTVTTLDPDQPATVTNSGTSSAAVFDFGIPKGDKGDTGAVSSEVVEELPIPGDDSKFYLIEKNPERNTESGEYINFETTQTAAAIQSAQIDGNATQTGTPTPDAPQPISAVTGENVVKVVGKNLLQVLNTQRTINGVTFTPNADGSVTVDGTATYQISYPLNLDGTTNYRTIHLPAGTYTISSNYPQSAGLGYFVQAQYGLVGASSKYSVTQFTEDGEMTVGAYIRVNQGATLDNVTFNIQLEKGSTATSYQAFTEQDYTISLGELELAKIGTYQDRIYKEGEKWYVEKQITKIVTDGSESGWNAFVLGATGFTQYWRDFPESPLISTSEICAISDYFTGGSLNDRYRNGNTVYTTSSGNSIAFNPYTADFADANAFKTWLSTHPTTVYYALATPTTTEITNQTLIDQLEALASATLNQGVNNIFTEIATGNAMPTLELNWVEWEKYNRYNVYIWNDGAEDYQILNS